jgi:uncharacterized protein
MMMHRFKCHSLPDQPWKNGLGMTKEIVSWPPGSNMSNFEWRVSIAHIVQDCSFSSFHEIDRVITLLSGAGVILQSEGDSIDHTLNKPLQPFTFAGDIALHARLIDGACHDFNLMTRRSICKGRVEIRHNISRPLIHAQGLVLVQAGQWKIAEQTLETGEGLWWHKDQHEKASSHMAMPSSDDAELIVVSIQPLRQTS